MFARRFYITASENNTEGVRSLTLYTAAFPLNHEKANKFTMASVFSNLAWRNEC